MALVAQFDFRNRVADISGYNNPTTLVGATYVDGRFGRGLSCTGTGGAQVTFPPGSYYWDVAGGKSFSCWVKASPGTAGQTRVIFHNNAVKLFAANSQGFASLTIDGSEFSSAVNICDGTWHHILVTWDKVTQPAGARFYIDGTLVASRASWGAYNDTGTGVGWIGRSTDGESLNGVVSDLRIWNDPVFPNEVAMFRDGPVVSFEHLALGFASLADSLVRDGSEYARHVAPTGTAQLATGKAGSGITSSSGLAVSNQPINLPPLDRVSLLFWLFVPSLPSTARTLVSVSEAGGTERIRLTLNTDGTITGILGPDHDKTRFVSTPAVPTGQWVQVMARGWAHASVATMNDSGSGGGPQQGTPVNTPSFTGLARLSLGAPGVVIDSLWILQSYMNGEAKERIYNRAIPSGVSTGILRGDGTALEAWMLTGSGLVRVALDGFTAGSDTEPPSVPTGVVASAVGTTGFTISWSPSLDAGEEPDTTAPSVPTGVAASAITSTGFTLNWGGSTDG